MLTGMVVLLFLGGEGRARTSTCDSFSACAVNVKLYEYLHG